MKWKRRRENERKKEKVGCEMGKVFLLVKKK